MRNLLLITFNFLVCTTRYAASFNIVGIFPFPGRSHYVIFDSLMVELAARGHNVTVYDTFPKLYSLPNYTQVSLKNCFSMPKMHSSVDQMLSINFKQLISFLPSEREILDCQPLRELRDTRQRYDLLITETFLQDFFALFGYALNVPTITFHSSSLSPSMSVHTGAPENPSYVRNWGTNYFDHRSFWCRVENFIFYLNSLYFYKFDSEYVFDRVAVKFFGSGVPTVGEAIRNASLMFTNSHPSFHRARPMVPNTIEVGGIHIKPAKPLPKDIDKFINESTHGVVYFSMGSVLNANSFSAEKKNAFLRTFAKIPQRVLWKWEGDTLPGKSENVMTLKWMPQRDILAHPNIKLFISHGGLLGLSEAVYEGVPVLGIPIFGSQRSNVDRLTANGAGERLDYNDISQDAVYEKVSKLLSDPKYKKNAVGMSIRFRDRPMSPLDTAVYWTEYVIRHKGAPHLKTTAVHMPWYQYLLLDVIGFLLLIALGAFLIIYNFAKITLKLIWKSLRGNRASFQSEKKVKGS